MINKASSGVTREELSTKVALAPHPLEQRDLTPFQLVKFGEEGPPLTTLVLGEEEPFGPLGTDIRVDDPIGIAASARATTLVFGEEGGGGRDPRIDARSPFGGF